MRTLVPTYSQEESGHHIYTFENPNTAFIHQVIICIQTKHTHRSTSIIGGEILQQTLDVMTIILHIRKMILYIITNEPNLPGVYLQTSFLLSAVDSLPVLLKCQAITEISIFKHNWNRLKKHQIRDCLQPWDLSKFTVDDA